MSKPKVTVALPLWDSGDIAWLCLESLCRQVTDVPWELVVVEENTPSALGLSGVFAFHERLKSAGCLDVTHLVPPLKIPLSTKWHRAAHEASLSSGVYVMCAADNYYQPNLVQDSWDAIGSGKFDWFQSYRCHFYDIDSDKLVEYDRQKLTGIEMSMKMELAQKIPQVVRRRGIDLFIYRYVKPQSVGWNESVHCLNTVCTHGRNKISGSNRKNLINKVRAPFRKCSHTLSELLPSDVREKLYSV